MLFHPQQAGPRPRPRPTGGRGAPLPRPLGCHILLELQECPADFLRDDKAIEAALVAAARRAGAHVVECVFHHFSPHGLSGVVVIAESHITIHTWPEHHYAAVDIFTCGDPDIARRIRGHLSAAFHAGQESAREITRGIGIHSGIHSGPEKDDSPRQ